LIKKQACTNHQEDIEWHEYAMETKTIERERAAETYLNDKNMDLSSMVKKFLESPLHQFAMKKSFGTLYSSAWFPETGEAKLFWKTKELNQSFRYFEENQMTIHLNKQTESFIF